MELFFAAEEEADPVALEADGDEVTVVFEGAGVFDAVLVELPQEARRGEESPARHCVVDRWNGTKEKQGCGS